MNSTTIGIGALTAVFGYLVYLVGRVQCKSCNKKKKICFAADDSCNFKMTLTAIAFFAMVSTAEATTICIEGEPVDGKVPYSCTVEEPYNTYSMKEKGTGGFLGVAPKSLPSVAATVVIWIAQEVGKEFISKYLEEVMKKKVVIVPKNLEPIKSH